MKYAIVIEQANGNLSAYIPDLPGCVATGSDRHEVMRNMREAIRCHIDGLREDGIEIPEPHTICDTVDA